MGLCASLRRENRAACCAFAFIIARAENSIIELQTTPPGVKSLQIFRKYLAAHCRDCIYYRELELLLSVGSLSVVKIHQEPAPSSTTCCSGTIWSPLLSWSLLCAKEKQVYTYSTVSMSLWVKGRMLPFMHGSPWFSAPIFFDLLSAGCSLRVTALSYCSDLDGVT